MDRRINSGLSVPRRKHNNCHGFVKYPSPATHGGIALGTFAGRWGALTRPLQAGFTFSRL